VLGKDKAHDRRAMVFGHKGLKTGGDHEEAASSAILGSDSTRVPSNRQGMDRFNKYQGRRDS
jgi:hypothetical protein